MAERIGRGDLSKRLEMIRHDEVGHLATALNGMAQNLADKAALAEQIAAGDLTHQVTLASDLDTLGIALQAMSSNLNEVLGRVDSASEQISQGSHQVAEFSQVLSQGATEQASSVEEIASSMNEMASQTQQNAENARQARTLSSMAKESADHGNGQMAAMVEAMRDINDSGKNISKIIKVIDEIAFQTNLLALNAAVEAARAGQHGKGFAVVAEEVRNLAARSAKAASETAELIEHSVDKALNGSQIADGTAQALAEIVDHVSKVTDLVSEISAASDEQALGITQINQGLDQISIVTQQNTAHAEESAAAAEQLSGQAASLREDLKRFRLQEHSSSPLPANVLRLPEIK